MPRTLRTGKLPAQPGRPRLELRSALGPGGLPTPPTSVIYDNMPDIGMLGNDEAGDCVEAGVGHVVEQDTQYATGAEQVVSTADTLALYTTLTGYNPNDPSTDRGTVVQDALDYWRKRGVFGGHKLTAFAAVKLSDWTEIELAVFIFGQVVIGFNFPESAMEQFNIGMPWTVEKGSPIDGGHCVVLVGYDADWLYVLTWGTVQKMSREFWTTYTDEAWVGVTDETITALGANAYAGALDLAALGANFAALTGGPNPFPAPDPNPPVPTPAPSPTPAPAPVVDAADEELYDAKSIKRLLTTHSDFISPTQAVHLRHDVRIWTRRKGFTA